MKNFPSVVLAWFVGPYTHLHLASAVAPTVQYKVCFGLTLGTVIYSAERCKDACLWEI